MICGDTCDITVGSLLSDGHKFTINVNAPEIDVRAFGSGDFGDWLACTKDGTITINTYMPVGSTEAGDTGIACSCNVGAKTLSATNCTCSTITCDVDAKGVVEWTYVLKLTGDVTGW